MRSLCLLFLFAVEVGGVLGESKRHEFVEKHMGADFRIVLYACKENLARKATDAAFAEVVRLNAILSDYDASSELSRLAETSGTGKTVPVGKDLWTVLKASQKLAAQTSGAFDVTVGPFVRRWRVARFNEKLPSAEKLELARQAVGHHNLKLFPKKHAVRASVLNMTLDLGGIAKGYAADKALAVLRQHGIRSALVDGGGDLTLGDPPPGRKGWRIEIGGRKHPDLPILEFANCAVATSGDIEQFVEIAGKRYSHLIDPSTGVGLTTQLQVTVVAPTGMEADSLASALSVLGPKKGAELLKKMPKIQAYFVQRIGMEKIFTAFGKE